MTVTAIISFLELLLPSHQSPVLLTLTFPSCAGTPSSPQESSESPQNIPSPPPPASLAAGRELIPLICSCSSSSPGEAAGTSLYLQHLQFGTSSSHCSAPQGNSAWPTHQNKHFSMCFWASCLSAHPRYAHVPIFFLLQAEWCPSLQAGLHCGQSWHSTVTAASSGSPWNDERLLAQPEERFCGHKRLNPAPLRVFELGFACFSTW